LESGPATLFELVFIHEVFNVVLLDLGALIASRFEGAGLKTFLRVDMGKASELRPKRE
jgi:hypothetical protein